jgi:hypothetical protein
VESPITMKSEILVSLHFILLLKELPYFD